MGADRAVPILTYHSIDASGSVISMDPALFRDQMQLLSARGYQALTVSELLDAWDAGHVLPARTVVITFDDAMANLTTHALPVMNALGFRATVYAVSGKMGGANDWPGQSRDIPPLPLLSREGLKELVSAGFEIGAHTVSHRRLTQLSTADMEVEVSSCRHELEEQLGVSVPTFAYPFGDMNAVVRTAATAHYRAALGTRLAFASTRDDRYVLPRVDMYYFRHPATFRVFDTTLGNVYLNVRAAARRLRASMKP